MTLRLARLFVYKQVRPDSLRDFIESWASCYDYPDDTLYQKYIRGPHDRDGLRELFRWKIGPRLFDSKSGLLDECFISRLDEARFLLRQLRNQEHGTVAKMFLEKFAKGGPIWRIFWLHCLDTRFPILDQHVHRAMIFIQEEKNKELPNNDQKKVELYLNRYLPFFQEHFGDLDARKVDKALWSFGKALKKPDSTPIVKQSV